MEICHLKTNIASSRNYHPKPHLLAGVKVALNPCLCHRHPLTFLKSHRDVFPAGKTELWDHCGICYQESQEQPGFSAAFLELSLQVLGRPG